jgi:hypothetical protein
MKEQLQVDELPVIRRALEQYKKILDELIQNDDPTIRINLFEEDLNKLSYQAKDLIQGMSGDNFSIVYDNKSFISHAVSSYIKYLKETKKYVYEKLGAEPKLAFIDEEIISAEKILPKVSDPTINK